MYAYLWQHLPGPTPVRVIIAVLLAAAVALLLWFLVFPWIQAHLPVDDTGMQDAPGAAATPSPGGGA